MTEYLIKNIFDKCQYRHFFEPCDNTEQCKYNEFCSNDCGQCLRHIHFQHKAPEIFKGRNYDCARMADYYVLQFGLRYASEMLYALENVLGDQESEISVLSLGCGPCTDLFAFDYLLHKKRIASLQYYGSDLNYNDVWSRIHRDICNYAHDNTYDTVFNYDDAYDIFTYLENFQIKPNVIVFQYVFSDMAKRSEPKTIFDYADKIAEYIINEMPSSVIIMNDINLTNDCGGGLDYFDYLVKQLPHKIRLSDTKKYFANDYNDSVGKGTYGYGEKYHTNKLHFSEIIPLDTIRKFSPKKYCASAQRIIVTGRR